MEDAALLVMSLHANAAGFVMRQFWGPGSWRFALQLPAWHMAFSNEFELLQLPSQSSFFQQIQYFNRVRTLTTWHVVCLLLGGWG